MPTIPHILKIWGVYQWKSYLIGSKKLDSVRRYADVQVARKRALMERGKIIPLNRISNSQ